MQSKSPKTAKNKRIFISHISEEAALAGRMKEALEEDFLGFVDIFVSSDTKSIAVGEEWLRSIEEALKDCAIMVVVCSPASISRSWINFEAGAAWIRGISLIPVCHSGLQPKDLPPPLSFRQGLAIDDPKGLQRLYNRVAGLLHCKVPPRDFKLLAHDLTDTAGTVPVASLQKPKKKKRRRGRRQRFVSSDTQEEKLSRLKAALIHERFKWRTLQRVAMEAAVSESEAADLLRPDTSVRFSKSRKGSVIVALRSRVG